MCNPFLSTDANSYSFYLYFSGLLQMGQNNFESAKQQFKECIDQDPGNHLAVNNFAVCSLYLGEMREAIRILESLLNEGYLHEGLIFNLCTLYELQSSRANVKKASILERLGRHCTDGFDLQSFKLQWSTPSIIPAAFISRSKQRDACFPLCECYMGMLS